MPALAEQILSKGLQTGFAADGERQTVERGPFTLVSSQIHMPEFDGEYIDQWIVKRIGGGQEIAQSGQDITTRLFAGGIVNDNELRKLNLSKDQVLSYLKRKLTELSPVTRLSEHVIPKPDGDWQYRYEILKKYPQLPLTIGVETISYKGTQVFVHAFLNSPVI